MAKLDLVRLSCLVEGLGSNALLVVHSQHFPSVGELGSELEATICLGSLPQVGDLLFEHPVSFTRTRLLTMFLFVVSVSC